MVLISYIIFYFFYWFYFAEFEVSFWGNAFVLGYLTLKLLLISYGNKSVIYSNTIFSNLIQHFCFIYLALPIWRVLILKPCWVRILSRICEPWRCVVGLHVPQMCDTIFSYRKLMGTLKANNYKAKANCQTLQIWKQYQKILR